MSRNTEREPAAGTTQREGAPGATQRETAMPGTEREAAPGGGGGLHHGLFPRALEQRFRDVRPLAVCSGEADCYLLRDGGETLFAKVYHRGKSPNADVMSRLHGAAADKVVRLIEFAPAQEHERAWELLEYMEHGSLETLMRDEGPKLPPARVKQILAEIVDALQHVHRLNVEHRDLKPANVLIRSRDPFDLVLADFGIASAMDDTMRFTSGHHTQAYGPPEAYSGAVFAERWDSWSLGIMLVEMLTGRHPLMLTAAEHNDEMHQRRMRSVLAVGNTDDLVAGVEGEDWIKLCRGLLRRTPELRWKTDQIQHWLRDPWDPRIPVPEERHQLVKPFPHHGTQYTSIEQLAAAIDRDPALLTDIWKRKPTELQNWLLDDLGDKVAAQIVEDAITSGLEPETQLIMVRSILAPDRALVFAGETITAENLEGLAARAADGTGDAARKLVRLYKEEALATAVKCTGDQALSNVLSRWLGAVADYERGRGTLDQASGGSCALPSPDDVTLGALLAGATGGSAAAAVAARARAAATAEARSCLWFQTLGAAVAGTPAANMLIINSAATAEAQVEAAAAVRDARNRALWAAIGTGAGGGAALGGVWWASVSTWCKGGEAMCLNGGWFDQSVNIFDLLFLAAAAVTASALLISVDQQTRRRY
jgi:serine/threonine protein kinase